MKILYVAVFTPTSTNVSQANAFRRLGAELIEYDYRAALKKFGDSHARDNDIIHQAEKEMPDAVLFSKGSGISRHVISELRINGHTCLYWFMDPDWNFRKESMEIAAHCNHAFVSRQGSVNKLKSYIKNTNSESTVSFLCEGFDADVDYPEDVEKVRDFCFIGNLRRDRNNYAVALKIPQVRAFGHNHAIEVGSTRINLNFTEGDGCSDRVYKVLAAGGFLLTQPWLEMTNHFTPGVHLDVFNSPDELKAKIDYYLKNAEIRESIAKNGLEQVQQFSRDEWAKEILNLLNTQRRSK